MNNYCKSEKFRFYCVFEMSLELSWSSLRTNPRIFHYKPQKAQKDGLNFCNLKRSNKIHEFDFSQSKKLK
eukprot:UN06423